MARVIGDFTPKLDEQTAAEEMTFGYFGATVRVSYDFGELVFTDWVEEFGSLGENDPKATQGTKALMRQVVHPDDFDMFWALAKAHKQNSEDLARVFQGVLEAFAERPTRQPSDSSAGQTSTPPSSAAVSSQRVIDRLEAQGRPDLAQFAVLAQEARTG